ncbi:MAG TPA: ribosome maturation factor RimP [Acidimicrobiales bacterium]
MGIAEQLHEIVAPVCAAQDVELVDVEAHGGVVRVTIDQPGGVDLDTIARVTRVVSRALDEHDPISGRYTLEVSSPGLERPLRTPAHFRRAIGSTVRIKTRPGTEGERRVDGVLRAADDEAVTVALAAPATGERRVRYDEIERARTVFEWGPAPKPGSGKKAVNA